MDKVRLTQGRLVGQGEVLFNESKIVYVTFNKDEAYIKLEDGSNIIKERKESDNYSMFDEFGSHLVNPDYILHITSVKRPMRLPTPQKSAYTEMNILLTTGNTLSVNLM